jgi:hypothetical protein
MSGARQTLQVTFMLDVVVPPGGWAAILHEGSAWREEDGSVDAVAPYTRVDAFTEALRELLHEALADTQYAGHVWAAAATPVAEPYTPHPDEPF